MTKTGLVDSNILIYAHDTQSPFFKASHAFMKNKLKSSSLCFALQVFTESYRIWTHKIKKPISPQNAWKIIEYYQSIDVPVLHPKSDTLRVLKRLTTNYDVKGVHIFDAYLVSVMLENDITILYTANTKDFTLYKEIKVVNPL